MEHWHLYMDEGGIFERLKRNDSLYIYALLIKSSMIKPLEKRFKKLLQIAQSIYMLLIFITAVRIKK